MLGAIIGDIAGSFREFTGKEKFTNLPLIPNTIDIPAISKRVGLDSIGITDDSVLSLATAHTFNNSVKKIPTIEEFGINYYEFGKKYNKPIGGYGGGFMKWINSQPLPYSKIPHPYNSCGNGSAMRVSPCGYIANNADEALLMAFNSSASTHNHPEGIKGAQATALAVYLARQGYKWADIKDDLDSRFLGYQPLEYIGRFDSICQETMRLAWHVLDTTNDFESAVFKAVTIPYADSDTLGAIVGAIAEPLYGIPQNLREQAMGYMVHAELLNIYNQFIGEF